MDDTKITTATTDYGFNALTDTITLGSEGYSTVDYGAIPSITIGSGIHTTSNTYTLGNLSINGATGSNTIWTTSGTGSAIGGMWNNPATTIDQGGKMSLRGENADIDINGKSMKAWMEQIEERLNILTPNPELEKEWDELRRLGERYRKLEKKCKEKAEMWNKLKSMPPPKMK